MPRYSMSLVAVLLVVVAACGGQSTGTTSDTSAGSAPAPSPTTTAADSPSPSATTVAPAPAEGSLGAPAPADGTAGDTFDPAGRSKNTSSNFPSLDDPRLVPASTATWLADDDVVLGVGAGAGDPQAYPISQMAYHHIANTTVAGEPYLVTY